MFYMNINIPKNVKYIIDTYYNNNYEGVKMRLLL